VVSKIFVASGQTYVKMVKNFVIPLTKDDLLTSHAGQYFVEEIVPLRMISQALDGNVVKLIFFFIIIYGDKLLLVIIVTTS